MGKLLYCYWRPRGLGNPAKMILEYGGIEYVQKTVVQNEDWHAEKLSNGFDFPNLPYIVDGDVKLSESWAIYRYLARKIGIYPDGEQEERQADMLQGVIQDTRSNFSSTFYRPKENENIDNLRVTQVAKIGMFEKYLKTREFLLGDKLSYLDFALYETLDHHRHFFEDIFDDCPTIQTYMKRFEAIGRINEYLKSDRFNIFPINGPQTWWGGKNFNDKK